MLRDNLKSEVVAYNYIIEIDWQHLIVAARQFEIHPGMRIQNANNDESNDLLRWNPTLQPVDHRAWNK